MAGVGLLAGQSAPVARPFAAPRPPATSRIPRLPDGHPNLEGIWQILARAGDGLENHRERPGVPAGLSVVEGGTIPYLPAALAKRDDNFAKRATADPLNRCFMPGVPRAMYMGYPFQVFQTPGLIAFTFEWQQLYRMIYTNGSAPPDGLEFWMGDSRGRWEGDTLVVTVTDQNDQTWLDAAGNFHSAELTVVERYTMTDPNTIRYEATLEDAKVFSRPWTMRLQITRRTDRTRLFEYQCQAEAEEANGAFERNSQTWYPGR